jgi:hypothetical protein
VGFAKKQNSREQNQQLAHLWVANATGENASLHLNREEQESGTREMMVFRSSLINEQSGYGRFADQSANTLPRPLRL